MVASVLAGCLLLVAPPRAAADGMVGTAGGGGGDDSSAATSSSPTVTTPYDDPGSGTPEAPAVHCTVYANGAGMGSYCATLTSGGGQVPTLRERFAHQSFQRCRYRPAPATWVVKENPDPEHGRYMVQTCIDGIDWDTTDGGPNRHVSIDLVWVPFSQDVADQHTPVDDYIWSLFSGDAQLPVPMLVTHPATPVVGEPTYFTMRWVDPVTRDVVAKGAYAGSRLGGPFQEVSLPNGIVMTATGSRLSIDPNQTDMSPVDCAPDTPYDPGAATQPADACSIDFPRSSASASRLENPSDPMPATARDHHAYWVAIRVHWDIRYGRGTPDRTLGDGFTMVIHQELPVEEIQAENQPPPVSINQ